MTGPEQCPPIHFFYKIPISDYQKFPFNEDVAIAAFGKNGQVKRVFWTMFVAMAGLVLARVVDPVTAQQVVGIIAGMGG